MKQYEKITFDMDKDNLEWIKRYVKDENISLNEGFNRAVKAYLEKHKDLLSKYTKDEMCKA